MGFVELKALRLMYERKEEFADFEEVTRSFESARVWEELICIYETIIGTI